MGLLHIAALRVLDFVSTHVLQHVMDAPDALISVWVVVHVQAVAVHHAQYAVDAHLRAQVVQVAVRDVVIHAQVVVKVVQAVAEELVRADVQENAQAGQLRPLQ